MFTPGTIKAIKLINSGVDQNTALSSAAAYDVQLAERRAAFRAPSTSTTTTSSTSVTPTTPTTSTPVSTQTSAPVKVGPITVSGGKAQVPLLGQIDLSKPIPKTTGSQINDAFFPSSAPVAGTTMNKMSANQKTQYVAIQKKLNETRGMIDPAKFDYPVFELVNGDGQFGYRHNFSPIELLTHYYEKNSNINFSPSLNKNIPTDIPTGVGSNTTFTEKADLLSGFLYSKDKSLVDDSYKKLIQNLDIEIKNQTKAIQKRKSYADPYGPNALSIEGVAGASSDYVKEELDRQAKEESKYGTPTVKQFTYDEEGRKVYYSSKAGYEKFKDELAYDMSQAAKSWGGAIGSITDAMATGFQLQLPSVKYDPAKQAKIVGEFATRQFGEDYTNNTVKNLQNLKNQLQKTYNIRNAELVSSAVVDKKIKGLVNLPQDKLDATYKQQEALNKKTFLGAYSPYNNDVMDSYALSPENAKRDLNSFLTDQKLIEKGGESASYLRVLRMLGGQDPSLVEENEPFLEAGKGQLIEQRSIYGAALSNAIYNKQLDLIKQQEDMVKFAESNKNLTKKQLEDLQSQYDQINRERKILELEAKQVDKTFSLKGLKENQQIKRVAGEFLREEEQNYEYSKKFTELENKSSLAGWFVLDPRLNKGIRTLNFLGKGIVDIVTGIPATIAKEVGVDRAAAWYETLSSQIAPVELVNFSKLDKFGNPVSDKTAFYEDASGETHYQFSGTLYQGAEMAPLIYSTFYGGSAIAGVGGRVAMSSVGKSLLSARATAALANNFAKTGSYGAALTRTMATSANPIIRGGAMRAPSMIAMAPMVYSRTFMDTYNDLYSRGVEGAAERARAVALVSAGIEVATELWFPDMKYLDDFAEKGVAFGGKWKGTPSQFNILYGDMFKNVFSGRTLEYLAANSAKRFQQIGAGARFVAVRGVQEGLEEVTAEILDFTADHMGMAEVKAQEARELTLEDLATAFTGTFVGPQIGIRGQIKNYTNERKKRSLFDIAINADYYQNKVLEAQKAGKIDADKAAVILSKINEIKSKTEDMGVANLRSIGKKDAVNPKGIRNLNSLMSEPEVQYDYFKKVLEKEEIDKKLAELDKTTYTEEEKKALEEQAKEATKAIDSYKRRISVYESLTDEDKQTILDNAVQDKKNLAKLADNAVLDKTIEDAETAVAAAILNKKDAGAVQSLRNYKEALIQLRQQRQDSFADAESTNTYNPIMGALLSDAPQTIISVPESKQDAVNTIAQTLVNPESALELKLTLDGSYQRELDKIEEESRTLTQDYLDFLNKTEAEDVDEEVVFDEDGEEVDRIPSRKTPGKKYETLNDLTDTQVKQLEGMLEALLDRKEVLLDKVEKATNAIDQYINNGLRNGTITEEEAEGIIEEASILAAGFRGAVLDGSVAEQSYLYSTLRFGESVERNKDAINAKVNKIKADIAEEERRERIAREAEIGAEAAAEESRGTTKTVETQTEQTGTAAVTTETRTEITPTGQVQIIPPTMEVTSTGEVIVRMPELIPEDMTPELEQILVALENIPSTVTTLEENNVTGDVAEVTVDNPEYTRLIKEGLKEVAKARTLNSAKAIIAALMTSANKVAERHTAEEIGTTLEQMEKMARSEAMMEEDYTHLFDLLLLTTDFKKNFAGVNDNASRVELGVSENQVNRKAQVEARIAVLNQLVSDRLNLIADNDNAAEVQKAWKDIFDAKKELEQLSKELPELANEINKQIEAIPEKPQEGVKPVISEEERPAVEKNTGVSRTSTLFKSGRDADPVHFAVQEKILQTLEKDFRETSVGMVDMFTVIEEVLGEDTLMRLYDIFNEVTADTKPSKERIAELRQQFLGLFPEGFIKRSALEYIFDKQMLTNISVTDVTANKPIENPTAEQVFEVNRQKKVTITKPNGVIYRDVRIATVADGKLLAVQETEKGKNWISIDLTTDKVEGLTAPIEGGRKININDINALTFTVIGKDGKVMKHNKEGVRSEDGNFALVFYLPRDNAQAAELRKSIADGNKVKKETKLTNKPVPTREIVNGESVIKGYELEFGNLNFAPIVSVPTAVTEQTKKENPASFSTKNRPNVISQADTVAKLDKVIEDSKSIGEPTDGYSIRGKNFERQSDFVRRANGEKKPEGDNILMERGAAVGNLLDIMGRDILGGYPVKTREEYVDEAEKMALNAGLNNKKGFKLNITQEAFDSMAAELQEFKAELEGKGWVIRTQNLVIFREYTEAEKKRSGYEGIAGAMDIVAVDPDGNLHIIDMKNKAFSNREKFTSTLFTSTASIKSNVSKWGTQQTVYGILTEDFGLRVASINALAFSSQYVPGETDEEIDILGLTSVKNKTEIPAKYKSPISDRVIKLQFDSNIVNKVDAVTVDVKGPKVTVVPPIAPTAPPVTAAPVVTEASVSDKKAEIERERQEKLEEGRKEAERQGMPTGIVWNALEINAKYDAELAALEARPTGTPTQLDLLKDQPRLTPEQLAARAEQERIKAAEEAARREEELQDAMADEQLYMEYLFEKEAFDNLDLPPIAQALDEMKITRDSFVQFSDKANLQGREGRAIIFGYIGKKGEGVSVDIVAERASDLLGSEVTTSDIIDFIMLYPGGIGGPSSKSSTTYYGAANPDTNPKYSSISNLIKERSKDAKRIKKRKALNKLQKNLTQIPAESIENVFDVLSSFNVDIEAEISRIKPSVTDTDTDINNKKC